MRKCMSLVLVLVVLASTATVVHAAKKQRGISMEVEWAQPEGSSHWTQVHLSASPAQTVRFSAYFSSISPSGIEFELGPESRDSLYRADPSYWMSARGFYISIPGDTMALMGTFWFYQNCLPGPSIQIEDREIIATNTTQISLYVLQGRRWKEIEAGDSLTIRPPLKRGKDVQTMTIVELKTAPSVDAPTCADARWRSQ